MFKRFSHSSALIVCTAVVAAAMLDAGLGEHSSAFNPIGNAEAQSAPGLSMLVRSSQDVVIPSGSWLQLNSDNWVAPNPLEVRITASCPTDHGTACVGSLIASVEQASGNLRINGATEDGALRGGRHSDEEPCELISGVGYSFSSMQWSCPSGQNSISLMPGETRNYEFRIVVQPSASAMMNIKALWAGQQYTYAIGVPPSAIHPVVLIPGILGTMPPQYDTGNLDPLLGVYDPMIESLKKMGYEENVSLFRMPYDWRNSNRVTARYLRDRLAQVRNAPKPSYVLSNSADLIVHSMGGIVTRTYVQGEALEVNGLRVAYNNDVRKVVFMATPHRGFPEDYKTYESNNWSDFLADTPMLNLGMNNILWPAFVKKHWFAANPNRSAPVVCTNDPLQGDVCAYDIYAMSHDYYGGIDSLREMLPTPDSDQYFGPYLCRTGQPCGGADAYPFGRPVNPLLPSLNANAQLLGDRIGAGNIYVVYGINPSTPGTQDNDTDVVYNVRSAQAPSAPGQWAQGEPALIYKSPAGDDLIPEYSMDLKLLLPSIPEVNVSRRSSTGTSRHKQIMYNLAVKDDIPTFLAGMETVPFRERYNQPKFGLLQGSWYWLVGECPINILLTDAQGRRLGYDSATGATYNEIPDTLYAAPNSENQFMGMRMPPAGTYHLKVSAFGDGKFSLGMYQTDPSSTGTPRRWLAEGEVKTGDVLEYDIQIDPAQPITNNAPTANAGPDQVVPAGAACTADVQLDGSASSDPDGEPLTFEWTGPFGRAVGAQPRVTLPVGQHDILLYVQDGQQKGRAAHTKVTVAGAQLQIKSVKPSVDWIEPLDGKMHSVNVAVDVSSACGGLASCRITKVEANEGDKNDWKITGPLSVELRAERSANSTGRRYALTLECQQAGASALQKIVYVRVSPAGRMKGKGEVTAEKKLYKFDFDISESQAGKDSGSLKLDISKSGAATQHFRATKYDTIRFYSDEGDHAGGGTTISTLKVYGSGELDGKPGYTFKMFATDKGEAGADRDLLLIEIHDPAGKDFANIDEKIDSGNIDSVKAPK